MNPLALIPLKDWLYLGLIAIVAAAGALFVHHERELGAAKAEAQLQHERAALAQASAAAASAAATETARREAALQEIVHENQEALQHLAQAAAANAADRSAFGVQLGAYVRAHAGTANPPAAAASAPAEDPILVLARLLDRADARASELARLADQRGAAGSACEQAYDALTPKN